MKDKINKIIQHYNENGYFILEKLIPSNFTENDITQFGIKCPEVIEIWCQFNGTIFPTDARVPLDNLAFIPGMYLLGLKESLELKSKLIQWSLRIDKFKLKSFIPVFSDFSGGFAGVDNSSGKFAFFDEGGLLYSKIFENLNTFLDDHYKLLQSKVISFEREDSDYKVMQICDSKAFDSMMCG